MTLEEGKQLLREEGIPFDELYYENDWEHWAVVFPWTTVGSGGSLTVLRVAAPTACGTWIWCLRMGNLRICALAVFLMSCGNRRMRKGRFWRASGM